jgi:hypothetical protein
LELRTTKTIGAHDRRQPWELEEDEAMVKFKIK